MEADELHGADEVSLKSTKTFILEDFYIGSSLKT